MIILATLMLAAAPAAPAPSAAPATPAAPAAAANSAEARFNSCVSLIPSDVATAQAHAEKWRQENGGLPALHCLALAFVAQDRFGPAVTTFEQAAKMALLNRDGRAAFFYVQAGNAAVAGDDPSRARGLFDAALALPTLSAAQQGEAHLDRARADVVLNDLPGARVDLDAALKLVPADPMGWLLSATLARRMGDLKRAEADIATAMAKAPDDAAVAYEAGNIAYALDAPKAAQAAWQRAAEADKTGPVGDNARRALEQVVTSSTTSTPATTSDPH